MNDDLDQYLDEIFALGPQAMPNVEKSRRMSDPGSGPAGLVRLNNTFPGKATLASRRQSDPGRGFAVFALRSQAEPAPAKMYSQAGNGYYASSASVSYVSFDQENAPGDTPTREREPRAYRRDTLRPERQQSQSQSASDGRRLSYAETSSATQSFVSLESGPSGAPSGSAIALSNDDVVAVGSPGRARIQQQPPARSNTLRAEDSNPNPWDAPVQSSASGRPPRSPARQPTGEPSAHSAAALGMPSRRGTGQEAATSGREPLNNPYSTREPWELPSDSQSDVNAAPVNNPYLRREPQRQPTQGPAAEQRNLRSGEMINPYIHNDVAMPVPGREPATSYQRDPWNTTQGQNVGMPTPYGRDTQAAGSYPHDNRAAVNNPYQRRDTAGQQNVGQSQRQPWEMPTANPHETPAFDPRNVPNPAQRRDPQAVAPLNNPSPHSNYPPSRQGTTPSQTDLSDPRRTFKVSETPTVTSSPYPGRQQPPSSVSRPGENSNTSRPPGIQESRPRLPSTTSNRSGAGPTPSQATTYPPRQQESSIGGPQATTTARPSTGSNRPAQSTPVRPPSPQKPNKEVMRSSITPSRPPLPTGASHMDTKYVNMLLAVDAIPAFYNLLASFFTWILLAGFVLLPGTFTSLQENPGLASLGVEAVNVVKHVSLFVIAWVCTGIGAAGMCYLWYRWRGNYIWLVNKIFMPGFLNSLAGVLSTLSSIFGAQDSTLSISSTTTIIATSAICGVCGILTAFYMFYLIGRLKKEHDTEVGKQRSGKHGEGVTDLSKRRVV